MQLTKIEIAQKFFKRIHKIELREVYSESEIHPLLRELERLVDTEWNGLRLQIDQYWRDEDDLVLRRIGVCRLRAIFHKVLKENNMDPLA